MLGVIGELSVLTPIEGGDMTVISSDWGVPRHAESEFFI